MIQMLPQILHLKILQWGPSLQHTSFAGETQYIQTIQVNTKMLVPEWDLILCLSLG